MADVEEEKKQQVDAASEASEASSNCSFVTPEKNSDDGEKNKEDVKFMKVQKKHNCSDSDDCIITKKKMLAASITYKDPNILRAIGGNRIR